MAPGLTDISEFSPTFLDMNPGNVSLLAITLLMGQDLAKGTVIGKQPTSGKYMAYDVDAAATAGAGVAGVGDTGNGTMGTPVPVDANTLTETLTVLFSAATVFTVNGSVSGAVGGTGATGVEFSADEIVFTITAGQTPFVSGDTFTIATVKAGARTAAGILNEEVDATLEDKQASMYVHGSLDVSIITGLDANGAENMNGRTENDVFLF